MKQMIIVLTILMLLSATLLNNYLPNLEYQKPVEYYIVYHNGVYVLKKQVT